MTTERPLCNQCGHPMHKAGLTWSGKKKVQAYKCSKCGHRTTKTGGDKPPLKFQGPGRTYTGYLPSRLPNSLIPEVVARPIKGGIGME